MLNLSEEVAQVAAQEEGLRIEFTSPTTGKTAWMIVSGLDSRRSRNARREAWRRVMSGRTDDPTTEDVKAAGSLTLAGSIIEWGGFTKDGTEELPLTVDNAAMVFTQLAWIEDEVDLRVGNRANFTKS